MGEVRRTVGSALASLLQRCAGDTESNHNFWTDAYERDELKLLPYWLNFLLRSGCEAMQLLQADVVLPELEHLMSQIDVGMEYVHEKLNTKHWKEVEVIWRKVYANLSLLKVIAASVQPHIQIDEVIGFCDSGLLVGCPREGRILSRIATALQSLAKRTSPNQSRAFHSHSTAPPANTSVIELPGKKSRVETCEVSPSVEYFEREHFRPHLPLLIKGGVKHWPATSKWTPAYFKEWYGSRTVPVELGSSYTAHDWRQKLMRIRDFVSEFMEGKNEREVGYLAQHNLFTQIPELMDDILVPEYVSVGSGEEPEINAWFGPSSTHTPTHYDPKHNLLAQVFGSKFIRLLPPSASASLYPYPETEILSNTSRVDMEDPEALSQFPLLRDAEHIDLVLEAGDILYIPPAWWHLVHSLSPSFSASFWFN